MKVRLEESPRAPGSASARSAASSTRSRASVRSTRRVVLTALDVLGYASRPPPAAHLGVDGSDRPRAGEPVLPEGWPGSSRSTWRGSGTARCCARRAWAACTRTTTCRRCSTHGVAGIVVSGIHAVADTDPARYRRLTGNGLPVVLVNGHLSPAVERRRSRSTTRRSSTRPCDTSPTWAIGGSPWRSARCGTPCIRRAPRSGSRCGLTSTRT